MGASRLLRQTFIFWLDRRGYFIELVFPGSTARAAAVRQTAVIRI